MAGPFDTKFALDNGGYRRKSLMVIYGCVHRESGFSRAFKEAEKAEARRMTAEQRRLQEEANAQLVAAQKAAVTEAFNRFFLGRISLILACLIGLSLFVGFINAHATQINHWHWF